MESRALVFLLLLLFGADFAVRVVAEAAKTAPLFESFLRKGELLVLVLGSLPVLLAPPSSSAPLLTPSSHAPMSRRRASASSTASRAHNSAVAVLWCSLTIASCRNEASRALRCSAINSRRVSRCCSTCGWVGASADDVDDDAGKTTGLEAPSAMAEEGATAEVALISTANAAEAFALISSAMMMASKALRSTHAGHWLACGGEAGASSVCVSTSATVGREGSAAEAAVALTIGGIGAAASATAVIGGSGSSPPTAMVRE